MDTGASPHIEGACAKENTRGPDRQDAKAVRGCYPAKSIQYGLIAGLACLSSRCPRKLLIQTSPAKCGAFSFLGEAECCEPIKQLEAAWQWYCGRAMRLSFVVWVRQPSVCSNRFNVLRGDQPSLSARPQTHRSNRRLSRFCFLPLTQRRD
jgi:hypothetical protein